MNVPPALTSHAPVGEINVLITACPEDQPMAMDVRLIVIRALYAADMKVRL